MDLEYDQKFEEMKKYIPFLESMIKRLESTNNGSDNPRKAQLDKIRSLRDLLLDKKKRMKMENLLKCEQVLVNLYAKVEQRDSMVDNKKSSTEGNQKEKSDLNIVRNKLKSVVLKLQDDAPETLPEIARATNTEVDCTPGSKEPALFQRRPNKASPPRETQSSQQDGNLSLSKRPYTRVLMSPEPKKKGWSASENTATDKPLFSRRSPRRSPRRYSPSYKRERKKSSKQRSKSKSRQHTKDLNITLKVPEESLSSLNTKDILSRIINCSDSDVDIDTLRGLRSQILGELKQTGAKDDISDLILKSYKKRKESDKKDDIEEGELSDSESEAIENIYGSLVVVNKDDNASTSKMSSDKQQPRKIQICLVINSEKENETTRKDQKLNSVDETDFKNYTDEKVTNKNCVTSEIVENKPEQENKQLEEEKKSDKNTQDNVKNDSSVKTSDIKQKNLDKNIESNKNIQEKVLNTPPEKSQPESKQHQQKQSFKPNFYQPLTEEHKSDESREEENSQKSNNVEQKSDSSAERNEPITTNNKSAKVKVKKDTVSEIDILQALKNEILGETVTTPNNDAITPPLHQPKLTKVSSAQEITSKKRISIENYKQKSIPTIKQPLFNSGKTQGTSKDDNAKKQSLKLTEKECERFNFPVSIPTVGISDDEDDSILSMDEIYSSLAPKSPDHEDFADTGIKPPVIIPSDPVKNVAVHTKADIDMRTLIPPGSFGGQNKVMASPLKGNDTVLESPSVDKINIKENIPDTQPRTESNQPVISDKSNACLNNSDRQARSSINYSTNAPNMSPSIPSNIPQLMSLNLNSAMTPILSPNIVPNSNMIPGFNSNMPILNPSMTPNQAAAMIPGMTPVMTPIMTPNSRSYEMTPRPNFDDDFPNQKHVYAPIFPTFEPRDFSDNDVNKLHKPHWETNDNSNWDDRNLRSSSSQRDIEYQRHRKPRYSDSYNRTDSPQIRMDCPATPNPSFGRMESPMTPVHSFGRSDCPMTPSHPFGRADSNQQHIFGRNEFQHNASMAGQKYIKSQDPRLNRSSEYDNYQPRNDDTNRSYYKGDYRRGKDNFYEHGNRSDRERIPRDYDTDGSFKNDYYNNDYHKNDYYKNDFRYRNDKSKGYDDFNRRRNQRARSITRVNPSEDSFSSPRESGGVRKMAREQSSEKLISVQSHTGRSFNIDTSFHRTFQENNTSSLNMSFNDRRRRASSVGRSLHDDTCKKVVQTTSNNSKFKTDVPDRSKAMNFRRACSVGRELKDYNKDRNLKDIKADLRSYKFEGYYKKIRDQDDRNRAGTNYANVKASSSSNESKSNAERRNRQREWDIKGNKHDDNSKYSPRKNYRDPRVRREFKVDNRDSKYQDKNKDSSRGKSYGIVYSNDNIAKGTILASAAGVRNFKIPKIKRPTEEKEVENVSKDDESNSGKQDMPPKHERKNDEVGSARAKKGESKGIKAESSIINKRNTEMNKSPVKVERNKTQDNKDNKTNITCKKKDEDDKQIDDPSIDSLSDTCEKRVTRSAKKGSVQTKQPNTESPVRKLRRIKKPLVYDSDSDSESSISNSESVKKDKGKNQPMKINETSEAKVVEIYKSDEAKKDSSMDSSETIDSKIVKCNKAEKVEKSLDNKHDESVKDNSTEEKNVGTIELKSTTNIRNDLCEEQNDSLDISFSVDDEMFNDNITSGSVLDNINALIADLDNDIEAPKINDFNDRFIKNIVGSISSNDSPIPLEVNEPDFGSDMISNNVENNGKNISKGKTAHNNNESGGQVVVNENDKISTVESFESQNNAKSGNDETITNKHENNAKLTEELPSENIKGKTDENVSLQSKFDEKTNKCRDVLNNPNNDAIVSTTNTDEKVLEVPQNTELSTNDTGTKDNFVPDSTINSNDANFNKESQETVPDSTNEVSSEMNSDITSTEISSDTLSKELSVPTSSGGIDSIGKLLSILEDKNKITELLSYLSKDSSENEKIKKKLEKLREIVSDDEDDNTPTQSKEDNKNKSISVVNENQKEKEVSCNNVPLQKNVIESDQKFGTEKEELVMQQSMDVVKNIDTHENKAGVQDQNEYIQAQENDSNVKHLSLPQMQQKEEIQLEKGDDNIQNVNKRATEKEPTKSSNEDSEATSEQVTSNETKDNENMELMPAPVVAKKIVKKSKITKRGRSRLAKKTAQNKRLTRSEVASAPLQVPSIPKKPSRELLKLQEDIREMFIKEDVLNATGIRMCRLAKMVNVENPKGDTQTCETEPVVVLEKIKRKDVSEEPPNDTDNLKIGKNKLPTTNETVAEPKNAEKPKYKPGPKSKTKKDEGDPYAFETDSVAESSNTVDSRDRNSDSESDSIESMKSFESSELLPETKKKPKRKRRSWQVGVIRPKSAKKKKQSKAELKPTESSIFDEPTETEPKPEITVEEKKTLSYKIPDMNCFVDKTYCFHKNQSTYMCRLCEYSGNDIVLHYKKQHPHSEIPLSRLNPVTAMEAIQQCENMNLQAVSKIKTTKYVCRFCSAEFKKASALERFFWHVVSVHTGEYKHLCSECINVNRCPFHLDIPPPPKNIYGQLIGYICGRCNFTQISLENLKTHVIVRHDDEQTEVYSINLSEIPKKVLLSLLVSSENQSDTPRKLRSTRSNQSLTEQSDDQSDITDSTDRNSVGDMSHDNSIQETSLCAPKAIPKKNIQSKFEFENDDNVSDTSSYSKNDEIIKAGIKLERDEDSQDSHFEDPSEHALEEPNTDNTDAETQNELANESQSPNDVMDCPHFKIKLSDTGTKEYICCINKNQHYQTTLLISLKKHVQTKHTENWDGYCFVCKAIVMSLGIHKFKDCLQHYLDKHMDNFPILEDIPTQTATEDSTVETSTPVEDAPVLKPYINVRPLSELISAPEVNQEIQEESSAMPKIQSVVSLVPPIEPVQPEQEKVEPVKVYKYEEAQQKIMFKKNRVVLETMLSPEKLIHVFKCAGRFCSYTTDSAEDALTHASTHKKVGGENSLKCAYCDFDAMENAIDLVMHVFKSYSHCSYACSKCFYRASVSQLVYAHIKRAHSRLEIDKVPVLSCATIVEDKSKDDIILTRDEAVMHYVCNNLDPETGSTCQFKSFVLTKFREHLHMKHASDKEFICFICKKSTSSSKLLANHLKNHGLRIYQCCRCLFGADNETDLMDHASAMHPLKQPKAYLRIITSKGPNSEVRVLPLAVLSKSSVQTTAVTPRSPKENPVKEAERSIDLEKLIGQTNFMIESMSTTNEPERTEVPTVTMSSPMLESLLVKESTVPFPPKILNKELPTTSSAALPLLKDPESVTATDVAVKEEPADTEKKDEQQTPEAVAPPDPDVVCLDSDDESRQVIDLSADDSTKLDQPKTSEEESLVKIPRSRLFKCSKCLAVMTHEGKFKKHIVGCFADVEKISCLHCDYVGPFTSFFIHTNKHLETSKRFGCPYCSEKFLSKMVASKHVKRVHGEAALARIHDDSERKERPKRKLSGEAAKTSEPVAKMKKYGPEDVDRLPINPILDDLVYCSICEFSTKVRLNMVRHLQLHAEQQPVPRTAPVNPVPHLDTNEKHFDKMVNLASSSISNKNDKANPSITVAEHLPPEAAAIYPKYVPARHRYTCGAKDCSYISVNESMFKFHWETLHQGTNDYHCVHCPPHQHLDTSKPLTAVRIISHLKMHDVKLYACSSCSFYYHSRKIIEKHLKEVHSGKVVIVREEGTLPPPTPPAPSPASTAPTMDLKPWQCGLCKFKSMLRPEVIEHCGKFHQSKMQFKCTYCGFRTSNIENISKHQSKQHPGKKEEVFYFYYREGSIPDESDGLARWQKQSQKTESTEIKTEAIEAPVSNPAPVMPKNVSKPVVNLDIVKQEVVEPVLEVEETIEDLCKEYGQFCDPNGLRYKCPLCKIVDDDARDAMQSHLYEELQYRKWGCAICCYKAFHKPGLQLHVQSEHKLKRGESKEPIELQMDLRIETWVTKLLEHQTAIIERNKENLAKQKAEILRPVPGTSSAKPDKALEAARSDQNMDQTKNKPDVSMAELEKMFGPFGAPSNMNYSCPKCGTSARTESVMQEHLESELNKIRWRCSVCNETFQTYHEAQFHCRSVHQGQSSRPVEATRDVGLRAAWVAAVLRVQKLSMNYMPLTDPTPQETQPPPAENAENSLLVVRYEENVPTPEEQMQLDRLNRKSDSEDDTLVIDEQDPPKGTQKDPNKLLTCPFCPIKFKSERFHYNHTLKHYGLKPYKCPYCSYSNFKLQVCIHIKSEHPNKAIMILSTPMPSGPPLQKASDDTGQICLVCEKVVLPYAIKNHVHGIKKPDFGMIGAVVYKCCLCLTLHSTVTNLKMHHKVSHPNSQPNYSFYKLHNDNRSLVCEFCKEKFSLLVDLRSHCEIKHGMKSSMSVPSTSVIEIDDDDSLKRKAVGNLPAPKRVAKKSTTKLPIVMSVARKSTTKLPYDAPDYSEEYSYYGTKPSLDSFQHVTTDLPVFNKMVQFSMKDLGGIFKMNPIVLVEDVKKKS